MNIRGFDGHIISVLDPLHVVLHFRTGKSCTFVFSRDQRSVEQLTRDCELGLIAAERTVTPNWPIMPDGSRAVFAWADVLYAVINDPKLAAPFRVGKEERDGAQDPRTA